MSHGTAPETSFDPDNRCWQRFGHIITEHFDAIFWVREDGRPVLLRLRDPRTGDTFTLAVIDSQEVRQPHVLLTISTTGHLAAHGPASGAEAADAYAPALAFTDTTVAATRPAPLHDPAHTPLPDSAWVDMPAELGATLRPADDDTSTAVVVLLDRDGGRLAAAGPFRNHATASAWQADGRHTHNADRLVVPLHPVPVPDHPRF